MRRRRLSRGALCVAAAYLLSAVAAGEPIEDYVRHVVRALGQGLSGAEGGAR